MDLSKNRKICSLIGFFLVYIDYNSIKDTYLEIEVMKNILKKL